MKRKNSLKDNLLDFKLSSPEEIGQELGLRLRRHRLMAHLKQSELAERAGLSTGTVKNLESKGQSSLESLIRIAVALDLVDDLSSLFKMRVKSIEQMEEMERLLSESLPKRVR